MRQQARSRPAVSRGRAAHRVSEPPAAEPSRAGRPTKHHSIEAHSRERGERRRRRKRRHSSRRATSLHSNSPRNRSPLRQVVLQDPSRGGPEVEHPAEEELPEVDPGEEAPEWAASGAPELDEEESNSDELLPAGRELPPAAVRTRLEEPRRSRGLPANRTSVTDRPLVLRPRVAPYPLTRIDNYGTWALIAPSRPNNPPTTQIAGEKAATRARVRRGQDPQTEETWRVGPNTVITHYGSDSDSYSESSTSAQASNPKVVVKRKPSVPRTVDERSQTGPGPFEAPIVQLPKANPIGLQSRRD